MTLLTCYDSAFLTFILNKHSNHLNILNCPFTFEVGYSKNLLTCAASTNAVHTIEQICSVIIKQADHWTHLNACMQFKSA